MEPRKHQPASIAQTASLSWRYSVKLGPLTEAGIFWKGPPRWCHQTVRYCRNYGHTWIGFTPREEKILHFLLWEKVRNSHYQPSIILAAEKKREYGAPASYLPSKIWQTWVHQVRPAAPGSHLQVPSLRWLLEEKKAESSSPLRGRQSKPYLGHKQGISSLVKPRELDWNPLEPMKYNNYSRASENTNYFPHFLPFSKV